MSNKKPVQQQERKSDASIFFCASPEVDTQIGLDDGYIEIDDGQFVMIASMQPSVKASDVAAALNNAFENSSTVNFHVCDASTMHEVPVVVAVVDFKSSLKKFEEYVGNLLKGFDADTQSLNLSKLQNVAAHSETLESFLETLTLNVVVNIPKNGSGHAYQEMWQEKNRGTLAQAIVNNHPDKCGGDITKLNTILRQVVVGYLPDLNITNDNSGGSYEDQTVLDFSEEKTLHAYEQVKLLAKMGWKLWYFQISEVGNGSYTLRAEYL